jgi:hypothetical protein
MTCLLAAISLTQLSLAVVAAAVEIDIFQAMVETARQSILSFQRRRMRGSPCGSAAAVEFATLRYIAAAELVERRAPFLWMAQS